MIQSPPTEVDLERLRLRQTENTRTVEIEGLELRAVEHDDRNVTLIFETEAMLGRHTKRAEVKVKKFLLRDIIDSVMK